MNYVIYGEESLLMEQKLNQLKKKYNICEENMNMMTYWCHESDMSTIIEDALTPPFLSEYKMVVVKSPLFLTTMKQKETSEQDIKLFMNYIEKDNPTTVFVIYHDAKNFDERKKVMKHLRQHAKCYDFRKPDYHDLYRMSASAFLERQCQIDEDALELFISRMPNDLHIVLQEINKLSLYSHHLHKQDVDKLVTKKTEDNVFELTKSILNKEMAKSLKIYKDLMQNNEEPIKSIVLIANSLRLLYQVKLLDRKGYNDKEIASMLSLNPYRLKYIRQDGKDYELKELLQRIDELSKLDVDIKTGKIDRYRGLELFLMRMKGR